MLKRPMGWAPRLILSAVLLWLGVAVGAAERMELELDLPGATEVEVEAGQELSVFLACPAEGHAAFWADGLPAGFEIDPNTGEIFGAAGETGVFVAAVGAGAADGSWTGSVTFHVHGAPAASFDDDVKSDILWRAAEDHKLVVWCMDGATRTKVVTPTNRVDATWRVVGKGDFNGDGKADILWRNIETGETLIWTMDGGTRLGSRNTSHQANYLFEVVGVGDFDGDTKADILWRHRETHALYIWTMDGVNRKASYAVGIKPGAEFVVAGVGDFDGDKKADILWRNVETHVLALWRMDGAARKSAATLVPQAKDGSWEVEMVGDFDGDGSADILWRHRGDHSLAMWLMNDIARKSVAIPTARLATRSHDVNPRGVR